MTAAYLPDPATPFRKEPREVTAKTRKRCPHCRQMIEKGERAVLTDDRHMSQRLQDFGRSYVRGAWHLWHPHCHREIGR